ncbi:MAG: hypothetical protein SFX74_00225 [Fimbriimonadaceae bacterium]|nr:hypothetical protein [Fimbriimonadaceae bacterium]
MSENAAMRAYPQPVGEERERIESRYTRNIAFLAAFLSIVPALVAIITAPAGATYLGFQYAADDQMVYAAWMRQAMDGRFLFDNRFTTDAQPGLTLNLYFLLLGWIAKLISIPAALICVRFGLTLVFVHQLYELMKRFDWTVYARKLALAIAVFGGGAGFLVWHDFGVAIVKDTPGFLTGMMLGRLPVDTWQPEAFVFPSMLTNGLFMAALCLMLFVFNCFLEAEKNGKAVLPGAIAYGVLMNIHSYDVLLMFLVMGGFLIMEWARDRATKEWIVRAFLIGLGAVPPAAWFVYVLFQDPVFQARALTPTYSPNLRQVLAGLIVMMLLAIPAFFQSREGKKRPYFATGIYFALIAGLAGFSQWYTQGDYFMSLPLWIVTYATVVFLLYSVAHTNPARNLIVAWCFISLIAIYFPALFQRKLAMGMSIPWAIMAAGGVSLLLSRQERAARNLAMVLFIIVLAASPMRWLFREIDLARLNVSNTIRHPVYLSPDMKRILDALNQESGRKVVLAAPGLPAQITDEQGQPIPDTFVSPILPDLNPIASGMTGAYTYAGHWSETPNYNRRVGELQRLFFRVEPRDKKEEFLRRVGATHLIVPVPAAFSTVPVLDLSDLGNTVVDGNQFRLVKL